MVSPLQIKHVCSHMTYTIKYTIARLPPVPHCLQKFLFHWAIASPFKSPSGQRRYIGGTRAAEHMTGTDDLLPDERDSVLADSPPHRLAAATGTTECSRMIQGHSVSFMRKTQKHFRWQTAHPCYPQDDCAGATSTRLVGRGNPRHRCSLIEILPLVSARSTTMFP